MGVLSGFSKTMGAIEQNCTHPKNALVMCTLLLKQKSGHLLTFHYLLTHCYVSNNNGPLKIKDLDCASAVTKKSVFDRLQ